jgi:hypothetical protein
MVWDARDNAESMIMRSSGFRRVLTMTKIHLGVYRPGSLGRFVPNILGRAADPLPRLGSAVLRAWA